MSTAARSTAAAFAALHTARETFLMPNAWDAGTAVVLADAGFTAIATTSAGIAFSLGKPDYGVADGGGGVTREEAFERMRQIAAAVDVPVNGDLESGYGTNPDAVAQTVRLAIEIGLAGGNVEDVRTDGAPELYAEEEAVERLLAARAAIDATGSSFVLTARTDGLLLGTEPLATAIRRANRYRAAGADCIYVPALPDAAATATLVREVDAPITIVVGLGPGALTVAQARAAGVARISVGGSLARAALGLVRRSAREMLEHGTFGYADGQIPQGELNALFAGAAARK